jgi:hypothetical protein
MKLGETIYQRAFYDDSVWSEFLFKNQGYGIYHFMQKNDAYLESLGALFSFVQQGRNT